MRIFLTGCARSGTTLLQRCFFSFANIEVIPKEIKLTNFIGYKSSCANLVGKRRMKSVFCNELSTKEIADQLSLIKTNNIIIIDIVRDGRDVVIDGKVSLSRWTTIMRQRNRFYNFIDMTIRYEELCSTPDKVQKSIAGKFNLKINNLFSEYPKFVPDYMFVEHKKKERYAKRSISVDSIHKDKLKYKDMSSSKEELDNFELFLKNMSYYN